MLEQDPRLRWSKGEGEGLGHWSLSPWPGPPQVTQVPGVLPLASVTGPPSAPRMSLLGWTLPLLLGALIVLGSGWLCEIQSSLHQKPHTWGPGAIPDTPCDPSQVV